MLKRLQKSFRFWFLPSALIAMIASVPGCAPSVAPLPPPPVLSFPSQPTPPGPAGITFAPGSPWTENADAGIESEPSGDTTLAQYSDDPDVETAELPAPALINEEDSPTELSSASELQDDSNADDSGPADLSEVASWFS